LSHHPHCGSENASHLPTECTKNADTATLMTEKAEGNLHEGNSSDFSRKMLEVMKHAWSFVQSVKQRQTSMSKLQRTAKLDRAA
jgi:hypothetical protein